MRVITAQSDDTCAVAVAYLHALLREFDGAVLLLCSGGSALTLLDACFDDVDWTQVTIGVVDERWRARQSDRNSAALLQTTLVRKAHARGACVMTIDHNTPTKEDAAERYQEQLRQWHEAHPAGTVVAILGIGPDGHTAGVMPFPEDPTRFAWLFESDTLVRGYDACGKNPFGNRVTLTLTYLRTHVDHAIVYAVGREKCAVVHSVATGDASLAVMPAQVVHAMCDARIFTDCTVAALS